MSPPGKNYCYTNLDTSGILPHINVHKACKQRSLCMASAYCICNSYLCRMKDLSKPMNGWRVQVVNNSKAIGPLIFISPAGPCTVLGARARAQHLCTVATPLCGTTSAQQRAAASRSCTSNTDECIMIKRALQRGAVVQDCVRSVRSIQENIETRTIALS